MLTILAPSEELVVRSNKMITLQKCFERGTQVFLGSSTGVLACTAPFRGSSGWEFGHFDTRIAHILLQADWGSARCQDEAGQVKYKQYMEASCRGLSGFSNRLARVAAGPVLREAAFAGDREAVLRIRTICARSGFMINTPALQGALGETAVHCAAAAGNTEALRALLDLHADPNAGPNPNPEP